MSNMTLGLVIGNRDFFPDSLCDEGRREIMEVLTEQGFNVVALSTEDTKFGTAETWDDAQKCANLFKQHAEEIDGILVTLPNFGDERGVANSIRLSGLKVPVLVHAFADDPNKMAITHRRDSFCGKMSVCNNLRQYGIPFSLTTQHTMDPSSDAFAEDLQWFAAVCRIIKKLKNARVGAIGTRPPNFTTMRYSEKLLETAGISVEPLDLSEVYGRIERLKDGDSAVEAKLVSVKDYVKTPGVPEAALVKMAKLALVVDEWIKANDLIGTAIQCWTSLEEFYGIVPCTVMSMMTSNFLPSACEVDVPGLIGMIALQEASQKPSALIDWNNNFGNDPNKAVAFHCSNFPQALLEDSSMSYQQIIAGTVGKENTYGAIGGRIKPGPFSYVRVGTDDHNGRIRAYMGEGVFTNDTLDTFGGYGVLEIPNLQGLLRHICRNGFEHHVAINLAKVSRAVEEAFSNYLGWDVYHHQG